MKRCVLMLALCAAAGLSGSAGAAEKFLLVKITGFDREVTYEVMSQEDLTGLEADITLEKQLHRKALQMAKDKWAADAEKAKAPFPEGAVSTRHASMLESYSDETKAKTKAVQLENRDEQEKQDKERRDDERLKASHTRVEFSLEHSVHKKDVDEEAIKKEHDKETSKAERYKQAVAVYKECMETLIAEKRGGAKEKETAKPDKKEAEKPEPAKAPSPKSATGKAADKGAAAK